jgi:hypothetical protein
MEPAKIWELIVKADDLLKYATEDRAAVRREQAAELLRRAASEAEAIGNSALSEQARTRLADLGVPDGDPDPRPTTMSPASRPSGEVNLTE